MRSPWFRLWTSDETRKRKEEMGCNRFSNILDPQGSMQLRDYFLPFLDAMKGEKQEPVLTPAREVGSLRKNSCTAL